MKKLLSYSILATIIQTSLCSEEQSSISMTSYSPSTISAVSFDDLPPLVVERDYETERKLESMLKFKQNHHQLKQRMEDRNRKIVGTTILAVFCCPCLACIACCCPSYWKK